VAASKPGVFEARFPGLNISLKDGAGGEVIDWSLDTDFLTATDAWSITLVDDRPLPRWYELQQVEIYIEGKRHLIGRCDRTERGAEGSIIKIEGRDYLADMTECNIDPSLTFRAGISLEDAILAAAGPVGITKIVSPYTRNQERTGKTPLKGPTLPKKFLTEAKPEANASIFSWGTRASARYGYTMQPGTARNELVLQGPTYGGQPVAHLYRQPGNPANNIVRGVASRNWGTIPTHFLAAAQQGSSKEKRTRPRKDWDMNAVVLGFGSKELNDIVRNGTIAGRRLPKDVASFENSGQLYRLRHFRDKDSKNAEQLNGAAARMIAGALKETLRYSVTVRGTSNPVTGAVWSYDCEVDVDDELARVNERMWIASRSFRGSASEVSTNLELWRPRTYQIDPEANG
jgi:prophage tail gpP-like protein